MQVIVKKVIFRSETGYVIAAATALNETGVKNLSIKGNMRIREGNLYECKGRLEDEKGTQTLHVTTWKPVFPKGEGRVVSYLHRTLGIDSETGKKMYALFGDGVFEVLKDTPEQIAQIDGIRVGGTFYNKVMESFSELLETEAIESIRSRFPVLTDEQVDFLMQVYGKDTEARLVKDPYEAVCEFPQFTFKTAETIAEAAGIKASLTDSTYRIRMAFEAVMKQAETMGHLYLPAQALIFGYYSNKFLMPGVYDFLNREVSEAQIKKVGNRLVKEGILMAERNCIYTKKDFNDEIGIAKNIFRLASASNDYANMPEKEKEEFLSFLNSIIFEFESKKGIRLEEMQKVAVITVFTQPLTIITGGPGTGKTTIQECILDVNSRLNGSRSVCLLAPTGQASRRMADATGREAATINSRCRISEDGLSCGEAIEDSLLIVDEFSMVGNHNASILFEKIATGVRTVIIGDVDQLPSVDAGNVLKELIASKCIPCVRLRFAFRSGVNVINKNAQLINMGDDNLDLSSDAFQFVELATDQEVARKCVSVYEKTFYKKTYASIAILSPYRRKLESGSNSLNLLIQKFVNPRSETFQAAGIAFRVGDPVMQTKNKNGRRNGDRGVVVGISKDQMAIRFEGEEEDAIVKKTGALTATIDLAYASTIHKSQGSEYEFVIIPLLDEMEVMLKRNLLYTAVTRAKKKVLIVGTKNAINRCIHTIDNQRRNTLLGWRIQRLFAPSKPMAKTAYKAQQTEPQYKQQTLQFD